MHNSTVDVDFYQQQGYCQIRPLRPGFLEDVALAAEALDQIIQRPVTSAHYQSYGNTNRKFRQLRFAYYQADAFRRLMQSEEIEAIARVVFGSQRMFVTHTKVSRKEVGENLPWHPHQDSAYKLRHKLSVRDGMTIAIFLEDADERNGTFQVYPGSHKLSTLPHRPEETEHAGDSRQLVVAELPDIKPQSVIARKGDILILHFDTIHQSPPNRSHGDRPVFLLEIKPHQGFPLDERGQRPVVLNGRLSAGEKLIYVLAAMLRRVKTALKRLPKASKSRA